MRQIPEHCSDAEINALVDEPLALTNAETILGNTPLAHIEHPLAVWLYSRFKPGSGRLTKDEAWKIGNELDAQATQIDEARRVTARLVKQIAELDRGLREALSLIDELRPPKYKRIDCGRFEPADSAPLPDRDDSDDGEYEPQ